MKRVVCIAQRAYLFLFLLIGMFLTFVRVRPTSNARNMLIIHAVVDEVMGMLK